MLKVYLCLTQFTQQRFSQAVLIGVFTDDFPCFFFEYSPSDWTYGEAVLKKRLGDNFFIYGM